GARTRSPAATSWRCHQRSIAVARSSWSSLSSSLSSVASRYAGRRGSQKSCIELHGRAVHMVRGGDSAYTRVMPQPDLAHLARDLTRIHDAVITGAPPPVQPRALVRRSWERMLRLGLDPAGANRRVVDDGAEVESRRQRSKLRLVVEEMKSDRKSTRLNSSHV